jgi:hypothetical protein
MLGAALTLLLLLLCLLKAMGFKEQRAAAASAVASATYLTFPWMLGLAWVSGTLPNCATITFNLALLAWFANWPLPARCIVSGILFAFASLIYEAYWFAFLPFAALLWPRCDRRRELIVIVAGLSGTQIALVAFNRAIAALSLGVNKSFNPEWLLGVLYTPKAFAMGIWNIYGSSAYALAAVFITLLFCFGKSGKTKYLASTLAPITAGILLSLTLMAAAGYGLRLSGLFGRTSIVVSWWLAIAIAIVGVTAFELPSGARITAYAAGVAAMSIFIIGTLTQSRYWINSWAEQQDILSNLPRTALLAAPSPSLLVIETPRRSDGVGTFNAPWDISAALWITAPDVADHLSGTSGFGSIVAVPIPGDEYWRIEVLPDQVSQSVCQTREVIFKFPTINTLLWKYGQRDIQTVKAPTEFGCYRAGPTI